MQDTVKLVMLGTGTPNADPERYGPFVAVTLNNSAFVFDCGPGVVRRASAASRKDAPALKVQNLNKLLIMHLHSDHTSGYPDFILTPAASLRDEKETLKWLAALVKAPGGRKYIQSSTDFDFVKNNEKFKLLFQ